MMNVSLLKFKVPLKWSVIKIESQQHKDNKMNFLLTFKNNEQEKKKGAVEIIR